MQMKLLTNQSIGQTQVNQNQQLQQSIFTSTQNQKSFVKLGYSGITRNCAALIVQGEKFCKSCNDKK